MPDSKISIRRFHVPVEKWICPDPFHKMVLLTCKKAVLIIQKAKRMRLFIKFHQAVFVTCKQLWPEFSKVRGNLPDIMDAAEQKFAEVIVGHISDSSSKQFFIYSFHI